MLHGYKKSRYNIYDNLEFLGLNPYEQKHFCFGEGGSEGSGESGATVDPLDSTSLSTDPPQLDAQQAADAVAAADAARDAVGGLSPEGYQAALDVASANVGGYNLGDFEDAVSQAAPPSDELDALEETGLLGYNDKAALGYLDTVAREERESDLGTARGIEGLYGLREGDVTPAPVGGFSYQGPGSTRAALSEMGKGAINLGSLLAETYPGLVNFASIIAEEEFGLKMPSLGLKEQLDDYFARDAASQREANIGAREGTGTIIDDFEEESVAGLFDTAIEAEQAQAEQQAEQNTQTSYPAFDNFDLGENDPETFLPPIPSVPTVAPKPAAEVVIPESKVRTASVSNLDLLRSIYGDDIANALLPTRTV